MQYEDGASEEYADLVPEQSEENLQLDGDEDDAYAAEGEQDYAIYDDVHDQEPENEGQHGAAADTDGMVCDDGIHCGSEDDQTVQDNPGSVGSGEVDVVMAEQRQHSHGTASTGPYSGSSRGAGTAAAAAADSSRPGRSRHSDQYLQQQPQEHTADHNHGQRGKAYHESMDRDHKRYYGTPGHVGGTKGRAPWEAEAATAAVNRQDPQMLARRRAQVVELYSGVVALAMQPRREDVSDSCSVSRVLEWSGYTGSGNMTLSVGVPTVPIYAQLPTGGYSTAGIARGNDLVVWCQWSICNISGHGNPSHKAGISTPLGLLAVDIEQPGTLA